MWHHELLTCLIKWGTDTIQFHSLEYRKYPLLIINLKQILHSGKTKANIDIGTTIKYDVTSFHVKKTIVKEHKYNWNNCNINSHINTT